MNTRIKELISKTPLRYNEHQNVEFRNSELEKFAELIIRECAKCGSKAMYPDSDPDYVGRKIREHFGVEE